jgi:dTDP-4-amino-4,6-dideoxygalactose transaminase
MGTLGATSFFPSKNLGCFGDGGAIFVNDASLAERVRMIANHGQSSKYVHDLVGVNSRLDTLQAAILRVKLRQLESYTTARTALASRYDAAFSDCPGLTIPARSKSSSHVFHQYTVQLDPTRRDAIAADLRARGVPTAIYYPGPIHTQKAFGAFELRAACPVSTELCGRVLSLPMHTEMDDEQIEHVTQSARASVADRG